MEIKRVVITGIGAVTPIGLDVPEYWDSLLKGKSGAAPITFFEASKFPTRFACEIKGFNSNKKLSNKEMGRIDRYTQLAMVSTDEALINAGLFKNDKINLERVGVIFSSGAGGVKTYEDDTAEFATGDGVPHFTPAVIYKFIPDIAAGLLSVRYGFLGPNYNVSSGCASGNHAMGVAFDLIRAGKADILVTGASEAMITTAGVGGFIAMKALSKRNDHPETASRPYDAGRDGFVIGEASGTLIFEELEHALQRGAPILCEVAGSGSTADAYHLTAPHPEGRGIKKAIQLALAEAGMQPGDIDYINTHGTGTLAGDVVEIKAIQEVFGDHAYKLNISSTKSMTGHCLGAAGAIESIACVLSMQHGMVPPTINHFEDDPAFDPGLNFTFNKAQSREVRAALCNNFGFGGHNAAIIFKKYEA